MDCIVILDHPESGVDAATTAAAGRGDAAPAPVVLMTTWRRPLPTFVSADTDLYTLGAEYVDSVRRSGGVPVLLPQVAPADVDTLVEAVDAVVVCGGGDVDPSSYNAEPGHVKDNDPHADATELALLAAARRRNLPTLAICRGMQLLNVAYGGDLVQDVTAPDTVHPPVSDDPGEVVGLRHDVEIEPGSRLADVLGPGRRSVNAIHHQGVGRVGNGLAATAHATDGLVEGLEPDDWPACLAVQWHPEKIYDADHPLFDWLVAAARATGSTGDEPR